MNENFLKYSDNYFCKFKDPEKGLRSDLRFAVFIAILFFLIFFVVPDFFYEVVMVDGISMQPTLHDDDKVGILKTSNLNYGDIVVFYSQQEKKYIIKRVIGLEGDIIEIKMNEETNEFNVYRSKIVDGKTVTTVLDNEFYINEKMNPPKINKEYKINKGYIFVMGDNRNHSEDSRGIFGQISKKDILGKGILLFTKEKTFSILGLAIDWYKTQIIKNPY